MKATVKKIIGNKALVQFASGEKKVVKISSLKKSASFGNAEDEAINWTESVRDGVKKPWTKQKVYDYISSTLNEDPLGLIEWYIAGILPLVMRQLTSGDTK